MLLSTINKLREENRKTHSLIVINGGNTVNNFNDKLSEIKNGTNFGEHRNRFVSCESKDKSLSSENNGDGPLKKDKQSKSEIRAKNNYMSPFRDNINSIQKCIWNENSTCVNNESRVTYLPSKLIASCHDDDNDKENSKERVKIKKRKQDKSSSEKNYSGIKLVRIICTKNNNTYLNKIRNTNEFKYSDKNKDEFEDNKDGSCKKKTRKKGSSNDRVGVTIDFGKEKSKTNDKTVSGTETKNTVNKEFLNDNKRSELKDEANDDNLSTCKKGITSMKVKNNLIKKKYRERANVDFFENLVLSTPTSNDSYRRKNSLYNGSSQKRLSLTTPEIIEFENMRTGFTPINGKTEGELCGKARKKSENNVGCIDLFDLSPIGNSINEKKNYNTDESNYKSSSKNSVGKVVGDILSGLNTNRFKGKLNRSKINCEKQNKFITQLYEKLSSEKNNTSRNTGADNNLISNLTLNKKVSKQITSSLENALEKQLGINMELKNLEDKQELIWNINEDITLHPEERNLLMQELMAEKQG
ncbi:hypothetical protein FG386_002624 [Cryptosporidium ryanae]|uniref:uncharacterized protein n=1 Tax=Cryptosporidium ryanae TaxID=515981 RepID=UPI00351A9057|nr:hypothetical protein FG386_002624 [Cryptosporidium ryanae]